MTEREEIAPLIARMSASVARYEAVDHRSPQLLDEAERFANDAFDDIPRLLAALQAEREAHQHTETLRLGLIERHAVHERALLARLTTEREAREDMERQMTRLAEVQAERERQDAKWGGPEHDDTHNLLEWWGFMKQRMVARAYPGGKADERRDLVQIAALAVAAIESLDRKAELGRLAEQGETKNVR